jgi:hypothetical protein
VNKVLALKSALRCLTCGLLSLVPVLGIPFTFAALHFQLKTSAHAPDDWPIARRYTTLGIIFAVIGLFLNVTALVWLGVKLAVENL